MARVAIVTYGYMKGPWDDPVVAGFEERISSVFAESREMPGYLRDCHDFEGEWPPMAFTEDDTRSAATVTLWQDLASVHAFAYRGAHHREALRRRKDWFVEGEWPNYALWWVADDEVPTPHDANARIEHLHQHGPSAFAFSFKHPFDADGNEIAHESVGLPARTRSELSAPAPRSR